MHNIDKHKLRYHFNKAANLYDENSGIQQQAGLLLIDQIKSYQASTPHIIDLGCGTGATTAKLANALNYTLFQAIDLADQLLIIAKQRLTPLGIQVLEGDFEEYSFPQCFFDLAFANMTMQWSADLAQTFAKIYDLLQTNSYFAFSIPLHGTLAELTDYSINPFFKSAQIIKYLQQVGYKNINCTSHTLQDNYDSLHLALSSLKSVGANYVFEKKPRPLIQKSRITQRQQITLTYHLGCFIALKS